MNKELTTLTKIVSTVLVTLFLFTGLQGVVMTSNSFEGKDETSVQNKDEEIEQLRGVLRNELLRDKNPEKLIEAIKRINNFNVKAKAAIPELINLLTFKHSPFWDAEDSVQELRPITQGTRYPAINALTSIGRPSLPALAKVIETENSASIKSINALYVLQQILRDEAQGSAIYLEQKAAESSSIEGDNGLSSLHKK